MRNIIILGGGTSLRCGVPVLWDKIKNEDVWAINFIYEMMPYLPKRLVFVDNSFYHTNKDKLLDLHKKGVEIHAKHHPKIDPVIKQYQTYRNDIDFAKDKIFIGSHGLSGIFALGLAIKEKYDRILLCGFDWGSQSLHVKDTHFCTKSDGSGKPHIYLDETTGKPNTHITSFDFFKDYKNIYNVSMVSHITVFPKITYEEMYSMLEKGNVL